MSEGRYLELREAGVSPLREAMMQQQLELIPLTAEQKQTAGLLVAKLQLDLEELVAHHAQIRKSMKELEGVILGRISRLSHAIRDGREPGIEDL